MEMKPLPENIDGVVKETHNFEHEVGHQINWGYVAVGAGLLAVAYILYSPSEVADDSRGDGAV